MAIEFRELRHTDFDQANLLLQRAFENPAERYNDLRLCTRLQPDGWIAAFQGDRIIGTVYAVRYDTFAHIGFMVVEPEMQGHGLGKVLMEKVLHSLEDHRISLVTLDASSAGHHLYPKLGFIDHRETYIYGRMIEKNATTLPMGVLPISASDLDELVLFDRPVFGADRRKIFSAMIEQFPGRGFLTRDNLGSIDGFVFAQMNRIGPWVLRNPDHSQILMDAVLTLPYNGFTTAVVPDECETAIALFEKNGFERKHSGWYMFRGGPTLQDHREIYYAQTSLGLA